MPDTKFAEMMDRARTAAEETPLHIPEDWMQGRTAYGGMAAAMTLKSMRRHVPEGRKIRSLLFSFAGPLDSGPFAIQNQVLRSGKSVTTIESRIVQNDSICLAGIGSFGGDRNSKIQSEPAERLEMPDPSKAVEVPYMDGLTPVFTRHFTYRWAKGDIPFSGRGGRELGGWINFREQTSCLTEEWLIAMADAWPTPVLARLTEPAAASTLTWALEFVHFDRAACSENEWWAYYCKVDSAERGYAHERSTVWDPEGNLAVFSHQTVAVFG